MAWFPRRKASYCAPLWLVQRDNIAVKGLLPPEWETI